MELKEQIVEKLLEHQEFVRTKLALVSSLPGFGDTWQRGLLQGSIGIIDEAREVRDSSSVLIGYRDTYILSEIGDLIFYALQFTDAISDASDIMSSKEIIEEALKSRGSIIFVSNRDFHPEDSNLLGLSKKAVFQERVDVLPELLNIFMDIFATILCLCGSYERILEAIKNNKEKLSKRYSKGFSVEESKNRVE